MKRVYEPMNLNELIKRFEEDGRHFNKFINEDVNELVTVIDKFKNCDVEFEEVEKSIRYLLEDLYFGNIK